MKMVDRFVSWFSPASGVRRLQARQALALLTGYEADKPSPYRKAIKDIRSGESLAGQSAPALRAQARHLERNLDIADHALNTLASTVIGSNGISVQPMPKNKDGSVNSEFAGQLKRMIDDWQRRPEVTRRMNFAKCSRLGFRTWVRDGEHFAQLLQGTVAGLKHWGSVPLSLEYLEADYVPFSDNDPDNGIVHGIQHNDWGLPLQYRVLKGHPGDAHQYQFSIGTKTVPADRMLHAAMVKRFHQARGVSLFASAFVRLADIKDYEESERIAAKVAASMTAYIKKGTPDTYPENGYVDEDGQSTTRSLNFRPGLIFDDLRPGEDVGTIDTSRPNSNAESFLSGQFRRASGALVISNSSFTRDYNGTYSAQRQELVETWSAYEVLGADYIDQMINPTMLRVIDLGLAAGVVQIPKGVDPRTIRDINYQMQAMPWIDPDKEAKAIERSVQSGIMSTPEGIRRRGKNPDEVYQEEKVWRERSDEDGMVFTTDPAHELSDRQAADKDVDDDDDESKTSKDGGDDDA